MNHRPRPRSLALISLALPALLATACTSASNSAGTPASGATTSGTPASSGPQLRNTTPAATGSLASLTWDLPQGEPTTLDYAKAGDYSPDTVVSNMCDDLLRLNPDFTYSPGLASSWTYKNPTTLVYTIRQGVKFWDGSPLTAADVVYSMQRNLNPADAPVNGGFYSNVKAIEQTGPYQVTVSFSHPDELFNEEMATIAGAVAEKRYMQAKGASYGTAGGGVMCSGPFELVKWNSGTSIILKRNPGYWDPAYEPKAATVTLDFISDSSTLTSGLLSGQFDGSFEVPPSAIPELTKSTSGKLYLGPSLAVEELAPTSSSGPMGNAVIRQALSAALDRQAIASVLYNGAAVPNKTLTPPSAWGTDPAAKAVYQAAYNTLPAVTSDLAAARKLVASQPADSKPIVLALQAGDQTQLNIATLIQQDAAQIGLHVTIKQMQPLDFSNLFYLPKYRAGIDLVLTSGYLDISNPLDYLSEFFGPGAIFNWSNYNNPTVTSLVSQARSTFNAAQRATLVVAAQKLYTAAGIAIPLVNPDEVVYLRNGVTGAPASFAYIYEPSLATVGASSS
jgi:peptide/nickel transport system substrate-binding protein